MIKDSFDIPILFIIFNRKETAQKVFDEIKKIKPKKLFVAADGPRDKNSSDQEKCRETRSIIEQIDWKCELKTLFHEKNLGVKYAPSSAISWFFENVEEGIILEDDCLPTQSFFWFCRELLIRYRNDDRIMLISGNNLLGKWKPDVASYFYSYYGGTWGWASWKRAWKLFDIDIKTWRTREARKKVKTILNDTKQWKFWKRIFNDVYSNKIDTAWDYQWVYAKFIHSGLSIVPAKNLVLNIGWGEEASNTISTNTNLANLPRHEMIFPLKDNLDIEADSVYDRKLAEIGGFIYNLGFMASLLIRARKLITYQLFRK